jgi:hypothetical protein
MPSEAGRAARRRIISASAPNKTNLRQQSAGAQQSGGATDGNGAAYALAKLPGRAFPVSRRHYTAVVSFRPDPAFELSVFAMFVKVTA